MLKVQMATADDAALLSSMGYTSYRHHFAHLWKNPLELDAYLEQEYGNLLAYRFCRHARWLCEI